MRTVTLRIDPMTWEVLEHVAASYHLSPEALASQTLYRDAATMTGWPGNLGADLRHIIADRTYPPEIANMPDVGDYAV